MITETEFAVEAWSTQSRARRAALGEP
jgi:hypothetical protein